MKRLSLLLTLACITTSTFAQTVNYGSSGLNQTSTSQPILFKNNGNEKVRIASDGNVGIGTNAPTEKLEVIGNLKVSGTIISNSSTPAEITTLKTSRIKLMDGDTIIRIGDSTIYLDPNRNNIYSNSITYQGVSYKGIGMGREALGKGSYSTALGFAVETGTNATNAIVIGSGNGLGPTNRLVNSIANSLLIGFNKNEQFFLNGSTGNVGIGTTTTHAALTIKNGLAIDAGEQNDGSLSINSLKFGSTNTGEGIGSRRIGTGNVNGLDFYTSSSNRMSITNGGNIGIGTSAPVEKLQLGDRFVYHDGGSKVLGYNFRYDGQDGKNKRILNDYTSIIAFSQGEISLKTAVQGTAGSEITFIDGILLKNDGSVGIGTTYIPNDYKLAVNGKIIATEILVRLFDYWPDYVFEPEHKLTNLNDLESYLKNNKHLPGIPTAKELCNNGLQVSEIITKQMEKIEELTLYLIDQNKKIEFLLEENRKLKK